MPQDLEPILPALGLGIAVLALLLALFALLRTRRPAQTAVKARPEDSLEATVAAELRRLSALETRVDSLDQRGRRAVQRLGVVRFNPFEDTGSNQSFALALLDDRGDGVVISSLHSRQSTRIYLKPINGGRSETALSEEEARALKQAGIG
jgi:hypothetical protein